MITDIETYFEEKLQAMADAFCLRLVKAPQRSTALWSPYYLFFPLCEHDGRAFRLLARYDEETGTFIVGPSRASGQIRMAEDLPRILNALEGELALFMRPEGHPEGDTPCLSTL